jgi:hypothetical protein
MIVSDEALETLLWEHIAEYSVHQPNKANNILTKLNEWSGLGRPTDLLQWWKTQDLPFILDMQSYTFWLWTVKGVNYDLFETVHQTLTPVLARSWTVPVIITTGLDDPQIEGGFRMRAFTILDYHFTPTQRGFLVNCPEPLSSSVSLDNALDFLSFVIEKHGSRTLGFRQLVEQRTRSHETVVDGVILMPETEVIPLDYDFESFGKPLEVIVSQPRSGRLSLAELLHVRHRAIINTDWESKLVSLWASIELIWGIEIPDNQFLTQEERDAVEEALSFLEENRRKTVVDHVKSLRKKTRNDRIIEGLEKLACARGKDVRRKVGDIHHLRSKCVHGTLLNSDETQRAEDHLRFMMQVIDELITAKLSEVGISLS